MKKTTRVLFLILSCFILAGCGSETSQMPPEKRGTDSMVVKKPAKKVLEDSIPVSSSSSISVYLEK